MEKHFYEIKNQIAYFKKVVKNMDMDDFEKEKKHIQNDVHFSELLFEDTTEIFDIENEKKHSGILHWIDLIKNDSLHQAVESLSYDEKYFISLLFYENRTQQELAQIYKMSQASIYSKIHKILAKIKNYICRK